MARAATDKIGLTMAAEADNVCVTGKCKELGLRDLGAAALAAEADRVYPACREFCILLFTIEARLPICDLLTRPGKFFEGLRL